MTAASAVAANRARILDQIAKAAKSVGRDPAAIKLVAVAKQQPADRIEAALAAGQRAFAENRVQEAQARWSARRAAGLAFELRLIGPLQTNKVRDAVALFDVIETLDRPKLAAALAAALRDGARRPRLYVQVNVGEEPQKAGVAPTDALAFVDACRAEHRLAIEGLMCIPPAEEPPAPHFALLADLAGRAGLAKLSMGMSADFECAVRLGATSVRVGAALFGARAPA